VQIPVLDIDSKSLNFSLNVSEMMPRILIIAYARADLCVIGYAINQYFQCKTMPNRLIAEL
jgi:hypothetical protein